MSDAMDKAQQEFNEALEAMKDVHTPENMKEAQENLNLKRQALFDSSDKFREQTFRNAEMARTKASGVAPSFPMPRGGSMGHVPNWTPNIDKTTSPLSDEYKIWGCPECGSKNVNWKGIGGRKKQREYIKHYGLDKRLVIDGKLRFCIQCSQSLKRDVLLKKLSLDDLTEIKTDYEEKRVEKKNQIP